VPPSLDTVACRLTPAAPFDFAQTLRFAEAFTPARGEQRVTQVALAKAIMIQGRPIGFHGASLGQVDAPALAYTLYGAGPFTPDLIAACENRLRFYLSLDDDLHPFYQIAQDDAAMAPIIARRHGLHQMKFPTPFENAAWAILTQRTPIAAARQGPPHSALRRLCPDRGRDALGFPRRADARQRRPRRAGQPHPQRAQGRLSHRRKRGLRECG
jgi:DNA-3-methyladenine glycosylase II